MKRRPLVRKLFPTYFVITLISVIVMGLYASAELRSFYYSQTEADLKVRAELVRPDIAAALRAGEMVKLARTVRTLGKASGTRVTVILPSGEVIADSESDPARMENHADRPEIKAAFQGRTGAQRRRSPTLGVTMLYVAIPVERDGDIVGVVRTSLKADALDAAPAAQYRSMALGVALVAVFAGLVSFLAVRRISGPLLQIRMAAGRFARGDFHSRVPVTDVDEFASLADSLNQMASQLDRQVRTIMQQAGEQNAILSSMKEAVIAVDTDDRVLILNPAAERILGVRQGAVKGKTIQEAIRNPDLQRFFRSARASLGPTSDEVVLHDATDRVMQLTGAALVDPDGREIGVLVVLNEVTQTRKLENLRRDFVANVSHELKTPITSIKGFVETLREGALDNPAKAREFLEIVGRQADRLNAIIEDLLALSKIEQDTDASDIPLSIGFVADVLTAAVDDCRAKAAAANVDISLDTGSGLQAMINAPLLEQAVSNLIDNAIKYSPGGGVTVSAEPTEQGIALIVSDTGCGIEPEHLPRLFERFYRVDKARSRKLGGTGLGLAIVKHIVQAHHGRVDVQSTPGKGSTFSIVLPNTDPDYFAHSS